MENRLENGRERLQKSCERRTHRFTIPAILQSYPVATEEFQSEIPAPWITEAKEKLRLAFDATEETWKAERYSTDLLIKLYHPGQNQIQEIWSKIDLAIAGYFDVCTQEYNRYRLSKAIVTNEQKAALRKEHVEQIVAALSRLTVEIAIVRQSPVGDFADAMIAATGDRR